MDEIKCLPKKMMVGQISIGNIKTRKLASRLASTFLALPLVAGIATNSFAQEKTANLTVVQSALHTEGSVRRSIEIALTKTGVDSIKTADIVDMLEAVISGREVVVKIDTGHGAKVQINIDTGLPLTRPLTSYSITFNNCAQARNFVQSLRSNLNGAGKNIDIQRSGNSVTVTNTEKETRLQFSDAET